MSINFCLSLALASILCLCSTVCAGEDKVAKIDLRNRTLIGVLNLYQRSGYEIIYSDGLVKKDMVVTKNPPQSEPVQRLKSILHRFGLDLERNDYTNAWQVISSSRKKVSWKIINKLDFTPISGVKLVMRDQKNVQFSDDSGLLDVWVSKDNTEDYKLIHPDFCTKIVSTSDAKSLQSVIMMPKDPGIEEVIVTSSVYRKGLQSFNAMEKDREEISKAPKRGDDPVQVFNLLPGVSTLGVSSKPNIRGGLDDELLILFDGVELLDPFHLKDFQSLLSGINANIVDNINFYTGGYPAQFGGRMSGVMDIRSSQVVDTSFYHQIGWNLFTTSLKLSGKSHDEQVKWLISGRRGNLDQVLEQVNDELGKPKFSDVYSKLTWDWDASTTIETAYLSINDDIRFQSLEDGEGERVKSTYNSQYLWTKANVQHSEVTSSQWLLTIADIENNRRGFTNEPESINDSVGNVIDRRDFHLHRLSYKYKSAINQKHLIDVGGRLEYVHGDYRYRAEATLGEIANLLGNERHIDRDLLLSPEGASSRFYLAHRYAPESKLHIESGIRFDYQSYSRKDQYQISPRIAMRYDLADAWQVKTSIGRYYQQPLINELDVVAGELEFYKPQRSDHYIVGLEYNDYDKIRLVTEFYLKNISSPRPRSQNLFYPYGFLPDIAPDRIRIQADKARASGFDSLIEYTYSPEYRFWGGYSFGNVHDYIDGKKVRRRWDQRHTLRIGMAYEYSRFSLDTNLQWHSGWRATSFPEFLDSLDESVDYERNNTQLPPYFSWDIRLSYKKENKNSAFEIYLEVINISNRANIGAIELEIEEADGSFDLDHDYQRVFPRIPTLGILWNF